MKKQLCAIVLLMCFSLAFKANDASAWPVWLGGKRKLEKRKENPINIEKANQHINASLKYLSERKKNLYPERVAIFSIEESDAQGLPENSPSLETLVEKHFSYLRSSNLYFASHFSSYNTLEFATANQTKPIKYSRAGTTLPTLSQLQHMFKENSGIKPDIYTLRVSAYLDRQVYTKQRGLRLSALVNLKSEYIDSEYDMELEDEISQLNISIVGGDPQMGLIGNVKTDLSAQVYRQRDSNRFALFVSQSSAQINHSVIIANGMNETLDALVSRAVLIHVSRTLGIDYWNSSDFGEEVDYEVIQTFQHLPKDRQRKAVLSILQQLGYDISIPEFAISAFKVDRRLAADTVLDEETVIELFNALQPVRGERVKFDVVEVNFKGFVKGSSQPEWISQDIKSALRSTPGVYKVSDKSQNVFTVLIEKDPFLIQDSIDRQLEHKAAFQWSKNDEKRYLKIKKKK